MRNLYFTKHYCKSCIYLAVVLTTINQSQLNYKARLVAKGFSQQHGVEYFDTFAPVARLSSIRLLLAMAVCNREYIHQMDVNNAFINGHLKEDIYMQQPEGFVSEQHPNYVCKLQRTLYGLKQAAREWYMRVNTFLNSHGFATSQSDQGIFCGTIDGVLMKIILYVDDILILCCNTEAIQQVKTLLSNEYRMKDLGEVHEFLGIKIEYHFSEGTMSLNQSTKIDGILERFNMSNCKGVSTPMMHNFAKILSDNEDEAIINVPYRELIGCLLYLSMCTRPDITYAITIMSKYCEKPTQLHWMMLKRILRYLKATKNFQLLYTRDDTMRLTAYSDADWASLRDRKSTSGVAIFYGNCLVNWKSKRQSIVALSTTEAELVALVDAYKEFKLSKKIIYELDGALKEFVMKCDNQPCISILHGNGYSGRAKHIDLRFMALQSYIKSNEFRLQYCQTSDMIADVFTKALGSTAHNRLTKLLRLQSSQ